MTVFPPVFPPVPKTFASKMHAFLHLEAAGGIMLMLAAVLALLVANSPLAGLYHFALNEVNFSIGFNEGAHALFLLSKPVLLWINDGLMVIFFFLVGLEIKRELYHGELASRDRALLPAIAAFGGMLMPAAIYALINHAHPENLRGWAIPAATDIAFALGVLALLGSRVPLALKVFLTAIAVLDDLGAIVIIAIFYTADVHGGALAVAALACLALFLLNRRNVASVAAYVLVGFVLWVALLKSGVHPTIGGVLTAFAIPMRDEDEAGELPVEELISRLHPWVAFLILPLFAFANAGVSLAGVTPAFFTAPLTMGIIAGLVVGKVIGVFSFTFLAQATGLCRKLEGVTNRHLLGMALLCGIGFTMSLFIGELALAGAEASVELRLGVLSGSVISAILGYLVLRNAPADASAA